MTGLRSLAYFIGLLLFTPVYAVLSLGTYPFSAKRRYAFITIWNRVMLRWLSLTCSLRYEVTGIENLPAGPAVILSNHQSAWETIAFAEIFPPISYVLKRELLRIPFFGWGLALTSPIAIDRAGGKKALRQLLQQGHERLKQGFWVVIYPEGTRRKPGELGHFAIGGAWLATHAGVPVVPVVHNAGVFWQKHAFLRRSGVIKVNIGPVINTIGRSPEQINAEARAWIESNLHLSPS
ncbi:MAG: 1-acyl-sn-glycerol-3-phosphate acyltransferase [Proteobacteria bacterium]|nr:1-acyl-sn-glycerol-3-phosphate acyltransferase [Pseudomonadota bacterium]MDE3208706.1 1-acyl-sn-glycerol-3-phosphate acyltransferase [Pseudomonadota bacterium]